jgi:hypothetical protein
MTNYKPRNGDFENHCTLRCQRGRWIMDTTNPHVPARPHLFIKRTAIRCHSCDPLQNCSSHLGVSSPWFKFVLQLYASWLVLAGSELVLVWCCGYFYTSFQWCCSAVLAHTCYESTYSIFVKQEPKRFFNNSEQPSTKGRRGGAQSG